MIRGGVKGFCLQQVCSVSRSESLKTEGHVIGCRLSVISQSMLSVCSDIKNRCSFGHQNRQMAVKVVLVRYSPGSMVLHFAGLPLYHSADCQHVIGSLFIAHISNLFALHSVLCALCPVPCALCSVPCALCSVLCALCPVLCAPCPLPR